ncbi:MAG TPA: pentapeptide repeat-containing protein [Xenococcaceae cyanobacterium]
MSKFRQPLGEILVEAGLVSISQIEIALQEQINSDLRIGEILAAHGWISQETADFFVLKWSKLLQEPQKKPLVYYFSEAGLLNKFQIQKILVVQKQRNKKVRFHNIAVELRYVKQFTVDFFLARLFNIHNPNSRLFTTPYSVIKDYTQGITNFKQTDLSKAPLVGVSLKGVVLDGSNLREADLTVANLSGSSLVEVDLGLANLTKAVLTEVNLTRAFLIKTNLQEAHLEKANFQAANLQGANLAKAYLAQVSFAGANLTQAKLPTDYPYIVYYDRQTRFDPNFDPKLMGWAIIE